MGTPSKLNRIPSSLSRSPSIKMSIGSLSCSDEAPTHQSCSKSSHAQHQNETKKKQTRLQCRILLPPAVVAMMTCLYIYARLSDRVSLHFPQSNGQSVTGFWLDYVFMLFFFSTILVSVRTAYPKTNLADRLRRSLSNNWGCLILACLKPLSGFLTDETDHKRASGVTWTIGSKPNYERLKSLKEGMQTYSNGDVYKGEFHQGRFSGSGVYYFSLSGRYEGDWVDGKFDGFGVETWSRGSCYRGHYRCSLREGYGVYRFFTGDVYSGEWSKGQSHGRGIQTCVDGSRYVGEFKWGLKHGLGYYRFRNGDTYAGEYFADKMHGYGVYQFNNGHLYEGAWHEGKRQGLGMYEFRNGERQGGYWHAGSLQTPSSRSAPPGASLVISHSKVLHAVQESRRASAKARHVSHVDERVKKAVASANLAAHSARFAAAKAVKSTNSLLPCSLNRCDESGHLSLHLVQSSH